MFPDIANVIRIRDALWRHRALGSASVMVGAGFSRNADPLSPKARHMPTWSQMAEALCDPLYPTGDANRDRALREANGTSGFLRLAQEYQAAFGKSSLNNMIRGLVPDLDYRPNDLHKRILRLPWSDVFSTNWDTLLERACADVFDRAYDIVRTVGEIPFTTRPRIVKLHGSFPGHEPFIFTEEEYRKYPAEFSPFVNLVQQSMMETIFCLIGFSGEDPNFLHWSGWVRDNLGDRAPRIYLAGYLELSVHRRRMLEARNVMPIDLAALPNVTSWPPELRHRYATEWFITALEMGKPYNLSIWPSPPPSPPTPPIYLGPIPPNTDIPPRREPFSPPFDKPQGERDQALREAVSAWSFNRKLYPGWIIAPESVRSRLFHSIRTWYVELRKLSGLSPLERLAALGEFAWRADLALFPLPPDLEDGALEALTSIDYNKRAVGGEAVVDADKWSSLLDNAKTLALSLSRNARHVGNRQRFDRATNILAHQRAHDPELDNAIAYEECLWDITTGNLNGLISRLRDWNPREGESIWSLRKAGLLAEMGEHERVCSLLEQTLAQIRRTRRRDIDDIVSLSLESWALYLALGYSNRFSIRKLSLSEDTIEPFERWRELAFVDCDAFSEYQSLKKSLEADKDLTPDITIKRGFDLDHASTTHHMGGGPSPTVIAAYQMVLLAEFTGIPPSAQNMSLFEEGLRLAAKALADDEPWLASQLALRIETGDRMLDDVLGRYQIARFSDQAIELLRGAALSRLEFGLNKVRSRSADVSTSRSIVCTAIEVLSRVALRLPVDRLLELLGTAVTLYTSADFRAAAIFFGSPIEHLMRRVLESLPKAKLADQVSRLFSLPLPHEVVAAADALHWFDVADAIPNWFDNTIPDANGRDSEWAAIVTRLIAAVDDGDLENRSAAIQRLLKLQDWNFLTDSEKNAFAKGVWNNADLDEFGIPQNVNLRPWALLLLPETYPKQASAALIKLISKLARDGNDRDGSALYEIGAAIRQLTTRGYEVDIQTEIKTLIESKVFAWTNGRARVGHPIERAMDRRYQKQRNAAAGVAAVLPYIHVSSELAAKLWDKASAMDSGGDGEVPAFLLYNQLLRLMPDHSEELLDRLRRALVSDKEEVAREAVQALYELVSSSPQVVDSSLLEGLIREIGIGIAARRGAILRQALEFARWLYQEGPEALRALILRDCEYGLSALLEEVSYRRLEKELDVPSIRAACVRLALAMASAGHSEERGVTGWLQQIDTDPLPEVRNAGRTKV